MLSISLEYQGRAIEASPFQNNRPTVDMMELTQTQNKELSDISLSLDKHGDVMIQTTGTPLTIERYGRKRLCTHNHPLKLFNNDILWVGDKHRLAVKNIDMTSPSVVSKISQKAVLASAAALALATLPACSPTQPANTETPAAEQKVPEGQDSPNSENNRPTEPIPYPEEVGEPPEIESNDPHDYPRPVGLEPAQPDHDYPMPIGIPAPRPEPPEVVPDANPDSEPQKIDVPPEEKDKAKHSHPKRVGKPPADYPPPMGLPVPEK
ncbi:MAG: hypothetical protein IJU23_10350 [Proteobacteria bacterium]|nr:hypothetical protein [Pseudomonadota bacterium]